MFRRFGLLISTLCLAAFLGASAANAATLVSLVGDKDCFGLGGSCPDGSLYRDELGGAFWSDYSDPGDPAFTDRWFAEVAPSYSHAITLGGKPVISAILSVRIAGVADQSPTDFDPDRGPWDVVVNGVVVGQIPVNYADNAFQEVITYSFDVAAVVADWNDVVLQINVPVYNDGYSVDYSELVVQAIPEPTGVVLFSVGLLVVGNILRRRQAA